MKSRPTNREVLQYVTPSNLLLLRLLYSKYSPKQPVFEHPPSMRDFLGYYATSAGKHFEGIKCLHFQVQAFQ